MDIIVTVDGREFAGVLEDGGAGAILAESLPIAARLSRWGEEYYGSVGVQIPEDATAREIMEVGEIAYWPPGSALCIFFGPTPASTDDRPRAASPVVPLGRVTSPVDALKRLGATVSAELRAE
jgi:hypothetical protein